MSLLKRFLAGFTAVSSLMLFTIVCSASDILLEVWNSDLNVKGLAFYTSTLVPAFEAAHPGVKVNMVLTPWGTALTEKTVTSYAAGVGPDIIYGGAEADTVILDQLQPSVIWEETSYSGAKKDDRYWVTELGLQVTYEEELVDQPPPQCYQGSEDVYLKPVRPRKNRLLAS